MHYPPPDCVHYPPSQAESEGTVITQAGHEVHNATELLDPHGAESKIVVSFGASKNLRTLQKAHV